MAYNIDLLKTTRSQALTKDYCYNVALEQCQRAEAAEAQIAALQDKLNEVTFVRDAETDRADAAERHVKELRAQLGRMTDYCENHLLAKMTGTNDQHVLKNDIAISRGLTS